jgi:Lrp/AsnC family transcriptional regulator
MNLSATDVKILRLLQQDASLTAAEIAEQVNLSTSPCWRRINRLEKDGIIEKKVALLDAEKLGMGLVVFSRISLAKNDESSLNDFEDRVKRFPEVVECYTVTGSADYFLKIITRDIKHYDRFLRRHLIQIPLVRDVNSNVAVTRIKYSTELPLETQLSTHSG